MRLLQLFRKLLPAKQGNVTWATENELPKDSENPLAIFPAFAVSKSHAMSVELQDRFQEALRSKCERCGEIENGRILRLGNFCNSCAEQIEREAKDDIYATARDGWHD